MYGNFCPKLVESEDVKPTDTEGQLYSLYYAILYKELEHLQILVYVRAPGTNTSCIPRDDYSWQHEANSSLALWNFLEFAFSEYFWLEKVG